jgi:alkaline phosphatase D
MTDITRRGALFTGISLIGVSAAACSDGKTVDFQVNFNHGVASGDPGADRMVIWTRISTDIDDDIPVPIVVKWEIATDAAFRKNKRKGKTTTDASRDYTVKVDASGLKPGTSYYYRFKVGQHTSPVGRTKTLPKGNIEQARFAVVSCSHFGFGYFNVYAEIAKQDHFDAVLHLGDYYYEYGRGGYGSKVGEKLGRLVEPAHEIITLNDYRTRHGQYKKDSASQAVHGAHPFIFIWDDHETANDSWKTGAENHNVEDGDWDTRRANAMKAYYEWMPVRDPEPGRAKEALFRSYSFGDLLTLCAIETRLTARTRPLDYSQHIEDLQTREGIGNFVKNVLGDQTRDLLGAEQSAYIGEALKTSKTEGQPWRLIANQVIMARIASPDLTAYKDADFIKDIEKLFPQIHDYIALSPLGLPLNLDAWDGYPAARERFYAMVQEQGVTDLLVLTGDTHECWANKLETAAGTAMGVELGTTSITSPGTDAYFGDAAPDFSARLNAKNDDVIYHNLDNHGYIDLTLNRESGQADFISIDTIYKPNYKAFTSKSYKVEKRDGSLKLRD